MALRDYLETAGNIGMGALETVGAPFQVVGETIRGASEGVPMKMASADDQSGYRWPSIVQRLAPSTRTDLPPADPFVKSYQGLEGLATLPYGLQAASDMVTREPGMVEQIGGMGLGLGVMPPVAKKIANAEFPKVDLPEAVMNERGAVSLGKGKPYNPPGSAERQAAFNEWFGTSKVLDESGKPATAFRGDFRRDLIKDRFEKGKSTSGRFYFTEDPQVASNYAQGKPYVPDANYENWFEIGTGRSKDNLDNAWYKLNPEQQAKVKDTFMRAYKDDATGDVMFGEADGGIVDPGHWDYALREARGNWLKAGKETWLNSGALYNDEEQFGKILEKAGIPFRFDDPHVGHPAVTPTHLAIKNPIDAANPPADFVEAVTKWASRSRKKPAKYGEDAWDKALRDPKEYASELQDAMKNHDNLWTTSIPDEVVKIAQKLGYDGIQDMGGKYGGVSNKQWIAFEPTQIKSATGNRGTFSPTDPNITHALPVAVGAGAAGAAAAAEPDEQQFAKGGIVQEESNMPCRNMNQGGFAEDWKNDLAGYMDEHFSAEPQPTQHMASGGVAGDDDTDFLGVMKNAAKSALNPFMGGGLNRPAPAPVAAPIPPIPAPAPKPVFNPKAGLPPAAAPPPVVSPTPAAPSGPDPMLQQYLSQQREALNKYGPDEQLAMEESIQKQRRGLIPNLALASTGLADAIMQGVARAGSSNFQSNLENRMDKTQEGQRKAFEGARTGHLAKMKQEMELATMDPESAISRVTQRTESPTLKAMGMSDDMIRQIPAGMMAQFRSGRLTLEDIRNKTEENRLKAEEYRLAREQRQREAAATAKKEAAEMAEKVQTRRIGAAKDLLTKSGNARAWGIPIPFTSDVSGKDKDAALAVLREGMQGATDYSSDEEAMAAGLPVGTPITINGRPAVVE